MSLLSAIKRLFGGQRETEGGGVGRRGPATHVIILDGTMSSLEQGNETHAGQLFKLLKEAGPRANMLLYYEAGIQWSDWRSTWDVMQGRGINHQIRRAYGVLASRYRPGDRIVLSGFSRGAYAARSLAGVIELVGLVRADCATERMVHLAYRHYRRGGRGAAAEAFRKRMCHDQPVGIEAVAVWDTVKALGVRLPIIWRWTEAKHAFHNHTLGPNVRHGFHALALNEARKAYTPVLWTCPPDWQGHVEQVWFLGTHGDVGGQLSGFEPARPLANLSLVWMLENLETCGLVFPEGWRARFPCDPDAPSIGRWAGWSKIFLVRKQRVVGRDRSEKLHPSAQQRHPDLAAQILPH